MTAAEFREAYEDHKDMLYRFARRMTGSASVAEDLVHDCFLVLWRNAAAYDGQRGTVRAFLIGVTRNLAPPDSDIPSIFIAVQEQLGLKLEATQAPVEMLAIDRAERPSGN